MKVIYKSEKKFNLTLNKDYEVLFGDNNKYSIENDNGLICEYSKLLFEIVEEKKLVVAMENVSANNVVVDVCRNGDYIKINLRFKDNEMTLSATSRWVSGNCGVLGIDGLNSIFEDIVVFKSDIVASDIFTIDENFEVELMKICISEVIEEYNEARVCAALVFSTNDSLEGEGLWKVMDSLSTLSTNPIRNPNSGNLIKTWYIELDLNEEEMDDDYYYDDEE